MQRVFLIHGWGGSPKNDWFSWAKAVLEKQGYEVFVPEMPETNHPKIEPWLFKLKDVVGEVRPDDILVGHSIGTLAILRFLETFGKDQKVEKVILIAPWQYLNLDEGELKEDVAPWINTPIDYEKIKTRSGKITAVFSDDDPWVPLQPNMEYFKEKLNPEIITKEKMGHFNDSELEFLPELI
ncbi:MAG: alpha/beta fold hydrolase [Candidatus Woesebacteria bacterium]|nr:MAG: alpha/beta fold hydrolase [Candidatus Woesebacteria bacterium]